MSALRILVAGIGHMGRSHALACHAHDGFDVVGLVNRSTVALPPELAGYPVTSSATTRPGRGSSRRRARSAGRTCSD